MLKIGNYYTINAMGDLRIVKLDGKTKGKRGKDLRWWYYGKDKDGNILAATQKEWRKFNPRTQERKVGDECEVVGNATDNRHAYHHFLLGRRVRVVRDSEKDYVLCAYAIGIRQHIYREWLKLLPGC